MKLRISIPILLFVLLVLPLTAQVESEETLAARLGYPPDAKLLIVHADDLGLAHSVNQAIFTALDRGLVTSSSLMVPCGWLLEVAEWAKSHPEADLGIHLTLTSEWKNYKWGPVLGRSAVPSLVDPNGFLWAGVTEVVQNHQLEEVEREIRAQIELAKSVGIEPTHLDSHMGTLFRGPELLGLFLKIGREYKLPLLLPRMLIGMAPFAKELLRPEDIVIDNLFMLMPSHRAQGFADAYRQAIENLQPGVTEIIIHPGLDNEELRGISVDHPDYGAEWRQLDLDFFTSDATSRLLEENGVKLLTWREIGKLIE
ncbi:MAG: polysaccharide deacetylase family protein [Acidobacteriota bacterium]|nr:MAG: polysaccharide deacetylase family protein [Acidobacteriota bacterium]